MFRRDYVAKGKGFLRDECPSNAQVLLLTVAKNKKQNVFYTFFFNDKVYE